MNDALPSGARDRRNGGFELIALVRLLTAVGPLSIDMSDHGSRSE